MELELEIELELELERTEQGKTVIEHARRWDRLRANG